MTPRKYDALTFVPWTCINPVKIEIKFHIDCKLCFPCTQFMLRQMHWTNQVGIELWKLRPRIRHCVCNNRWLKFEVTARQKSVFPALSKNKTSKRPRGSCSNVSLSENRILYSVCNLHMVILIPSHFGCIDLKAVLCCSHKVAGKIRPNVQYSLVGRLYTSLLSTVTAAAWRCCCVSGQTRKLRTTAAQRRYNTHSRALTQPAAGCWPSTIQTTRWKQTSHR